MQQDEFCRVHWVLSKQVEDGISHCRCVIKALQMIPKTIARGNCKQCHLGTDG